VADGLLSAGAFIRRKLLVRFQVEFEHIDSRFSKKSWLSSLGMSCHQSP
jgi:hypothetical protein